MVHIRLTIMLALSGCASMPNAEAPPPDAKAVVLQNKSRIFKDPESVRSTSITQPFRNAIFSMSWLVCVRANAKNSFGGYTGESDMLIALHDIVPEVLHDKAPGICDPLPHEPFPELEGKIARRK